MSLVLKSNNTYKSDNVDAQVAAYKLRVTADGGTVFSESDLIGAYNFCEINGLNELNCFSATSANWGVKMLDDKVVKIYSLFDASGDLEVEKGDFTISTKNGVRTVRHKGTSADALRTVGVLKRQTGIGFISASRTDFITNLRYLTSLSTINGTGDSLLRIYRTPESIDTLSSQGVIVKDTATNTANMEVVGAFQGNLTLSSVKGSSVITTAAITTVTVTGDIALYFGRKDSVASTGIFLGDMGEVWCLYDTQVNKLLSIGSRLQTMYGGK